MKVVYIAGYGRSGSTLVESILTQKPGVVGVGEVHYLMKRGYGENRLCSCGAKFDQCSFWAEISNNLRMQWGRDFVNEYSALRSQVARVRFIPYLFDFIKSDKFQSSLSRYLAMTESLYIQIEKVSGANIIVDSSKDPTYLLIIKKILGNDLRILHIVRDSRAVAFSWQRVKSRTYGVNMESDVSNTDDDFMPRYSSLTSACYWMLFNGMCDYARKDSISVLIRYEDLVQSTEDMVCKIFDVFGLSEINALCNREDSMSKLMHSVSGNPMRLSKTPLVIKADNEWTTKMAMSKKMLVTSITSWGLRKYNYI